MLILAEKFTIETVKDDSDWFTQWDLKSVVVIRTCHIYRRISDRTRGSAIWVAGLKPVRDIKVITPSQFDIISRMQLVSKIGDRARSPWLNLTSSSEAEIFQRNHVDIRAVSLRHHVIRNPDI